MKKLLSIISATAIALTMSISAFADNEPTKDEIVNGFMEYEIKNTNEDEWEYYLTESFDCAFLYNDLLYFVGSDDFANSKFANIDLSDKHELNNFEECFYEWRDKNDPTLYPKIKWGITESTTSSKTGKEDMYRFQYMSEQDYETTYTAKKSNNQWIMKEDKSGKVVMKIPLIPSKFKYIYEDVKKDDRSDAAESIFGKNNDENSKVSNDNNSDKNNTNNDTNNTSDNNNNVTDQNNDNNEAAANGNGSAANNNARNKSDSNNNAVSSSSSESSEDEDTETDSSNSYIWIVIIVAVIAAGIVVYVVLKKKK